MNPIAPPPLAGSSATRQAIKRGLRTAELVPAGPLSQLASYVQIVLAVGLLSAWLDQSDIVVVAAVALAVGVLLSVATPIGSLFTNVSGAFAVLAALIALLLVHAFTDGRLLGAEPWLAIVAVGLGVLGLDWRFVPRLRARLVCSGLLVIPVIGARESWAYAGALAWIVGLCVGFWLFERDTQRASMRPIPVVPRPANATSGPRYGDLARTAGLALAGGLAIALLLGDTSCGLRDPTSGDLSSLDRFGSSSNQSFGGNAPLPPPLLDLDATGREYEYDLDSRGDRFLVRPGDPNATYEVDEDGRVVVTDPDGSSRTYSDDGDGRWTVEVDDLLGQRTYEYEQDGDELRVTERDEEGDEVREWRFDGESRSEGSRSGGSGSSGSGSASARSSQEPGNSPSDAEGGDGPPWSAIIAGVAAVAAVAFALWWLLRRRSPHPSTEQSWALDLAARLDEEGRRRGRGRRRDETVVDHTNVLAEEVIPDRRLATVGSIVSAALFGRSDPPADTRRWVDQVVDEATDAHPPLPRRTGRRKTGVDV